MQDGEFMTSVYENTIQELVEEVQKLKQQYSHAVYTMREEKEELTEIVREQKLEIRQLNEVVQKMSTEIQQLRLLNGSSYNDTQGNQMDDCLFEMHV